MAFPKRIMAQDVLVDEAQSIASVLAGDHEAYFDLIAPCQRLVYLSVLSILRNEAEAEDCAQDAFLKAFQKLSEFKGESKFSSWLVRIALNEAKMRLRKLRPNLFESLDVNSAGDQGDYVPQQLGDWREIPSEALERKEVRSALENALQTLPAIYREVFILRDVEGLNVAAAARVLDVSQGVVRTRLLRARLQLRDLLVPIMKGGSGFSRRFFPRGKNPWL